MGRGSVSADERVNVVVYARESGRVLAEQPVFEAGHSVSENSLIAFGRSSIVGNNYTDTGAGFLVKDPSGYPGVTRIDMNENCDGCAVAWESGEAFCAVVLKLSAGSGLESVRNRKCVWQKRNRNVEGLQKKSFAVRFFVQQIRYTAFAAFAICSYLSGFVRTFIQNADLQVGHGSAKLKTGKILDRSAFAKHLFHEVLGGGEMGWLDPYDYNQNGKVDDEDWIAEQEDMKRSEEFRKKIEEDRKARSPEPPPTKEETRQGIRAWIALGISGLVFWFFMNMDMSGTALLRRLL